ncbi:Transposase IS200 like protein [Caloramator mitchellensis]|uniref:Transposase IS200 like protein n=1 Tax=Caloramator mitchellensis TaxID=908809 RepID=A0A0R3JW12_CALMK|nr:transposase [Caloramator mitchellensis]KRQ87755.1 Transposase IS200 like protein [Caloramator mitchellensis]
MPRVARVKAYDAVYHIMSKSISEVDLFRDDNDKRAYFDIVKKYQGKYEFKIYAYCLMTNHVHLIVDSNGYDISKIMHGINLRYVQYFNKKYKRHGHLFHDRFRSIAVKDDRYLITLSAYVHNNPLAIKEYRENLEAYEFSSLGVYLGLTHDKYGVLDESFIMGLFGKNVKRAREKYFEFVNICNEKKMKKIIEFEDQPGEYRSERIILRREYSAEDIIKFMEETIGLDRKMLHMKYNRKATEYRALAVFLMRCLCGYKYKEICEVIGGVTLSRVSKLCNIGYELIMTRDEYKDLINKFLDRKII